MPSCSSASDSGGPRCCSAPWSWACPPRWGGPALAGPSAELETLRSRLGLHPRSARGFLDALVALGMLERTGGRYANTPATEAFLDRAKPSYLGGILEMANARLFGFWADLTQGLRTGLPQNQTKTGGSFFPELYADPARLREFARAMTALSTGSISANRRAAARAAPAHPALKPASPLQATVAPGGSGKWAVELARAGRGLGGQGDQQAGAGNGDGAVGQVEASPGSHPAAARLGDPGHQVQGRVVGHRGAEAHLHGGGRAPDAGEQDGRVPHDLVQRCGRQSAVEHARVALVLGSGVQGRPHLVAFATDVLQVHADGVVVTAGEALPRPRRQHLVLALRSIVEASRHPSSRSRDQSSAAGGRPRPCRLSPGRRPSKRFARCVTTMYGPDVTFLGVRKTDLEQPESFAGADVVIVGAPFDSGTSYRPGARFGPLAIRTTDYLPADASRPHLALRVDPLKELEVVDAGDVAMPPGQIETSIERLEQAVHAIARAGAIPVVLGGDHTIALPDVTGVARHLGFGRVSVVHFDAHADTGETQFGSLLGHGTPMRRLIESGAARGDRFLQIGLRGYWPEPPVLEWMAEQGMRSFEMAEVVRRGLDDCLDEAFAIATDDCDGVFLSIDVDVVDPGMAPGTGTPEPGGLTGRQLLDAVRRCALELPVVGLDVVELSPPYDGPGQVTAFLANRIVLEALSGIARRRRDTISPDPPGPDAG